MTAKEYLSKIQTYRRIVQSYADRVEELYHEAAGLKAITYDKDRVQVSPEQRMDKIFARIDAAAERLEKARMRYDAEVDKRIDQIKGMEKPLYAELLHLVYIDGLSLRMATAKVQVAHPDRAYGENYIRQVHGWALDEFDKKYKISPKYNQI